MIGPPTVHTPDASAPADPALTDPLAPIAEDVLCRRCGYNLRGLRLSGRCPECNSAVELSLQGDAMRFADPLWLKRLSGGASVLMVQKILFLVWTIARVFLIIRTRARFNIDIMTCLIQSASLIGWWLMSTPDPAGLGEKDYGRARRMTRLASVVLLFVTIVWQVRSSVALPPDIDPMVVIGLLLIEIISIVGERARYQFIAGLSLRVPSNPLARRARTLAIIAPALAAFSWLLSVASMIAQLRTGRRVFGPPIFYGCSLLLLLGSELVLAVVVFALLRELRDKIESQARVARRIWESAQSGSDE